jgi:hypothetical protein
MFGRFSCLKDHGQTGEATPCNLVAESIPDRQRSKQTKVPVGHGAGPRRADSTVRLGIDGSAPQIAAPRAPVRQRDQNRVR